MEVQLTAGQKALALQAIEAAEASIARGEGRVITQQSMNSLADDVKQRGRARLADAT